MQVFLAGSPVTVDTVFTDSHGNPLDVVSARYRVLGHGGEELQPFVQFFGGTKPTEPVPEPEPTEPPPETEVPPEGEVTQPEDTTAPPEGEAAPEAEPQGYSLFGEPVNTTTTTEPPAEVPETMPTQLTIPGQLNTIPLLFVDEIESDQLDGVSVRQLRTVEFRLRLKTGNTILRRVIYGVEPPEVLIAGVNSFQSYSEAVLVAFSIPNLPGWDAADEQQRQAALVEARHRITRLHFRDASRGQSYLNVEVLVGDISRLAPREFKNLSVRLRAALCKAQVAEADALLGGDPESQRRTSGLIHETVGESSQTWRPSKPLDLPVGRKALGYLSGFISLSKQIGRAN